MSKRVELAASAVCTFCFETIPARSHAYMTDDCLIECAACQPEAKRAKAAREQMQAKRNEEQQDLFGGDKP